MLRLNWRDWLRYSLIGAGVGAVVLGIGGRLAMRGIAVLSGAPPQTILFYAIIVLITLRGLKPVDAQRLVLFLPVVLLYAFLVRVLTRRRRTLPADPVVEELSCA